jgi:hypothetical protein
MFRWGSRKAKSVDVDDDFDERTMENVGIPTSSTRRNERRSKPRKPEDDDENERNNAADAFKARKPPSRAHMTDEELVREWYAILPSMYVTYSNSYSY